MKKILIFSLIIFGLSPHTVWSFSLSDKPLPYLAPSVSFTVNNKLQLLSEYKNKKVMLWLFSTWCHTCVASLKALHRLNNDLKQQGLVIIALRNYNNGGYPGVSIKAFVEKFEPKVNQLSNWVIGDANKDLDDALNSKKFPDVYFLIDENGNIVNVNTAPNLTKKVILDFAHEITGAKGIN